MVDLHLERLFPPFFGMFLAKNVERMNYVRIPSSNDPEMGAPFPASVFSRLPVWRVLNGGVM
ncbi:MAG: hypothetical protein QW260_03860 [Thermoproteota archaeon]